MEEAWQQQLESEAERAQLQPQKQAERVTWKWRQKSTLPTFPPVNLCLLRFHHLPNTGLPPSEDQVFKYESHGGHRSFKPPYKAKALCTKSSPNPLFLQIPKEKECFNQLFSLPITSNGWIHIGAMCERGGLSPHTGEARETCHKISRSGKFTEQRGTWWPCPSFISVAATKYPDQKPLRGRKGLFQLMCY